MHCPRGHVVDRDAAAVLNMLWKTTPTGWVKAVWWDVKEIGKRLKKEIVPREAVGRANHIIPRPVAYAVLASLRALKAGDKWPAVLARAAPTTPAQGTDEGGTRAPPRLRTPFRAGRRSADSRVLSWQLTPYVEWRWTPPRLGTKRCRGARSTSSVPPCVRSS